MGLWRLGNGKGNESNEREGNGKESQRWRGMERVRGSRVRVERLSGSERVSRRQ